MKMRLLLLTGLLALGCGANSPTHGGGGSGGSGGGGAGGSGGGGGSGGAGGSGGGGGAQSGCAGQSAGCYTVYAHSDHTLYSIDLMAKMLVTVGPFKAPKGPSGNEDSITDLAVAPDNTIYVISKTQLYTASPTDGHVTVVGPVTVCGQDNVALTTTPDAKLFVGDFKGAFCEIDITVKPPMVRQIGMLGNNLALSGDLVGVADGTVYGSAYNLTDATTANNNILVKLDTTTGQVKSVVGATGFPKLFGISYALGQVFGFTHDGSGDVVTIDPKTGKGTPYNSFMDPSTGKGISFAGAGVNSMVPAVIM